MMKQVLILAASCLAVANAAVLKAADFPTKVSSNAKGEIVKHYALKTPGGIKGFNPFLTDAEAVNGASYAADKCEPHADRPLHATCSAIPALASGLTMGKPGADGAITFYAISDRGPNQDCGDLADSAAKGKAARDAEIGAENPDPLITSGKGFPVEKFSPTFGKLTLDSDGTATATKTCYLKRKDGSPASGISTRSKDDTPVNGWCQAPLKYDRGGQDAEDIQEIPGTKYGIICDEYSPSVSIVHLDWDSNDCGKVLKRYVPASITDLGDACTADDNCVAAGYDVSNILPESLAERRKNRGFENIAVSPDGKTAVAIMQSGMDVKSQKYFDQAKGNGTVAFSTRDAEYVPAVFLDISDPLNAKVLGTKYYPLAKADSWSVDVANRTKVTRAHPKDQDKAKLSAAFMPCAMLGCAGDKHVVVVLERETGVRLYLTDFEVASMHQEKDLPAAVATVHMTQAELASKGKVTFAKKALIMDTNEIPQWHADGISNKGEGFAFPNEFSVVIANDNDFGLENNGPTKISLIQLGKSLKDIAKDLFGDKYAAPAKEAPSTPSTPSTPTTSAGASTVGSAVVAVVISLALFILA